MSGSNHEFDTISVQGGYDPKQHNWSVSVPIYQTASFEMGSTERARRLRTREEAGFFYSRTANPTVDVLEKRLAELSGASGAVAVSSGMAAVSYTLLNVLGNEGGRIVASRKLYGGTLDSLKKIFPAQGVSFDYPEDSDDPAAYEAVIRPETKAILVESVSNPDAAVADLEGLAAAAHSHGLPLIVDNTIPTPYLLNPFDFGADVVVYSTTKAINGHGNSIGGIVLENGKFFWAPERYPQFSEPVYTLRGASGTSKSFLDAFPNFVFTARIRMTYAAYLGSALSPFNAYLTLNGLETLSARVKKQVENTEKIVAYLQQEPGVKWVKYPRTENSPYRRLADKYLPKGAGSVFTFGFNGTDEQIDSFIDHLKIFHFHQNIGDARSLVTNSPKSTHAELTPEEQALAGIERETVRLSIGLEDPDDLVADLKQAFRAARS